MAQSSDFISKDAVGAECLTDDCTKHTFIIWFTDLAALDRVLWRQCFLVFCLKLLLLTAANCPASKHKVQDRLQPAWWTWYRAGSAAAGPLPLAGLDLQLTLAVLSRQEPNLTIKPRLYCFPFCQLAAVGLGCLILAGAVITSSAGFTRRSWWSGFSLPDCIDWQHWRQISVCLQIQFDFKRKISHKLRLYSYIKLLINA